MTPPRVLIERCACGTLVRLAPMFIPGYAIGYSRYDLAADGTILLDENEDWVEHRCQPKPAAGEAD